MDMVNRNLRGSGLKGIATFIRGSPKHECNFNLNVFQKLTSMTFSNKKGNVRIQAIQICLHLDPRCILFGPGGVFKFILFLNTAYLGQNVNLRTL